MNKYEKWYAAIIENAKHRVLDSYKESHHIIPRSLGGNNDITNLVDLTAREHFICHWLLTKIYTGSARGKMINAMYIMRAESSHQKRYDTKITARIYENLREEYAEYISKLNKGRIQSPEEKAKQILAQTGRTRETFSDKWKENLSKNHKSKNPNYNTAHSEETKKKMSEKAKGRKYSAETIEKRAAKIRGSKREKLLCPHCNEDVAVNGYARWHGANCRHK
jgi:hypothetical protein